MRLTTVALLAGVAFPAAGQAPSRTADLDRYQASLDSLVPALLQELGTPGAAVALLRDGKVALANGYGWADREKRRPVTRETLFNIGSISKTHAAWGLLRLVQDGKLDLDAPVERYLTRWHLPRSGFNHDGVTLRRLLSHTAGLRLHGYPGFDPGQRLPTIEESLNGQTNGSGDVRVIMEPGSKWQYSGGGYTIAQLLVEEITGKRFNEYMQEAIFRPLGMHSSSYVWDDMVEARAARPYGVVDPIPGPRFTAQAAASLQTSLDDFVRFALASMSGERAALATAVLRPETVRAMEQPVPPSPNYGLGYQVIDAGGLRAVGHGGSNRGWQAQFLVLPSTGDGLLVMTNSTIGFEVHRQLFCAWRKAALAQDTPCLKGIGPVMAAAIGRSNVREATAEYRRLKAERSGDYNFADGQLNSLAFALAREGRLDDAIAVLELNVEAYPNNFDPHDGLGEALLQKGDTAAAIRSFERAASLNPAHRGVADKLKRLRPVKP
jgi:CubicO group peptidase (beta-lactamase class C family)